MTIQPGNRLGPYEILAAIGAGGMGEVYRTRDPRVGRDVAVKVSTERFSERYQAPFPALQFFPEYFSLAIGFARE